MGDKRRCCWFRSTVVHLDSLLVVGSTSSSNINVAAYSIYGLGNLGVAHPNAIECLRLLIMSPRRMDENPRIDTRVHFDPTTTGL